VVLGVQLRGFARVMVSVFRMSTGRVCVVCGFLVVSCIVMLGGFGVVPRRMSVVLGGLAVVLGGFLRHNSPCSP
jgi:hypothetical protein